MNDPVEVMSRHAVRLIMGGYFYGNAMCNEGAWFAFFMAFGVALTFGAEIVFRMGAKDVP